MLHAHPAAPRFAAYVSDYIQGFTKVGLLLLLFVSSFMIFTAMDFVNCIGIEEEVECLSLMPLFGVAQLRAVCVHPLVVG
jgi:hypothetical protein